MDGPDTAGPPAGMTLPSGVGRSYVRAMASMAGADVIAWGMRLIGLEDPRWLSDLAGRAAPGAGGLFLHPYLSPAGERAPIRNPLARGSLVGVLGMVCTVTGGGPGRAPGRGVDRRQRRAADRARRQWSGAVPGRRGR